MGLRINQNIAAFNAYRNLSVTTARCASRWRSSPPASASTARPTTPPVSRSPRACARRSVASRSPSATPRTASRSCRPLKVRSPRSHSILQRMRDLSVQASNTGGLDDNAEAQHPDRGHPAQGRAGPHRQHDHVQRQASCSTATSPASSRSAPTPARPLRPSPPPARAAPRLGIAGVDVTVRAGNAATHEHRRARRPPQRPHLACRDRLRRLPPWRATTPPRYGHSGGKSFD